MKHRSSTPPGRPTNNLDEARQRREQAQLANQAKIAALKRQQERVAAERAAVIEAPPRLRNADALLTAIGDIPLTYAGESEQQPLSSVYRNIIAAAVRRMNDHDREVVLVWPHADPAPAIIPVMLALADCASSEPIKCGEYDARAEAVGLRALIYPYTRTERHVLRTVHVDKGYVAGVQLAHQVRLTPNDDEALADFHKTLARVGTLSGKGRDGKVYPEFLHPCADEIIPTSRVGQPDSMAGLLWRVRTKTDLRRFERDDHPAEQPDRARFYLFGIHADDEPAGALAAIRKPLDLVLIDLTRTGTQRLGRDWQRRIKDFVRELDRIHPKTATLILTDDPWTFDAVRFDVLRSNKQKREKQPLATSSVLLAHSPTILGHNQERTEYATVATFEVSPYAGALEDVTALANRLARRAVEAGDIPSAEAIYEIVGVLRRCSALPAPLPTLTDFVASEIGERATAERLAGYSASAPLSDLLKSKGALAQLEAAALAEFAKRVRAIERNAAELTPMAPIFETALAGLMNKSSRSAVLFRDSMLADFAAEAFAQLPAFRDLERRFSSKMLYFVNAGELDDIAREPPSYRNQFKTLIIVGLARQPLLATLARDWLPERVVVIGDTDTLAGAARDATRLLKYDALAPLKERFEKFVGRASEDVRRVIGVTLNLDDPMESSDDGAPATQGVLNLAGDTAAGQALYRFELDTGDVIIAKPGTQLVLQDSARLVPTFYQEAASHVDVGDHVCVIGDAFIAMARPLLNIAVRAAEEIRDYHQLVLRKFAEAPGSTPTEKLTAIVRTMALPDVSVATARYWIDLEDELVKPLEEVVPHAPRDRSTYNAFMAALDVSPTFADHYWTWAVIAQRALKVRAALRYHEAYRAILVSPHAAQADNPTRARDIKRIRAMAESFVGRVTRKAKIGGGDARS